MSKEFIQDENLEFNILSCMLSSVSELEIGLTYLKKDDFFLKKNQIIFEAMKCLFDQEIKTDGSSLSNWLNRNGKLQEAGGMEYIAELLTLHLSSVTFLDSLKLLQEESAKRKLSLVLQKTATEGLNSSKKISDVITQLENDLVRVLDINRLEKSFKDTYHFTDQVFDKIEKLHANKIEFTGITSGIDALDDMTGG
jgi:replicative DNA helicase